MTDRALGGIMFGLAAVALAGLALFKGCDSDPDGVRADSVIAADTVFARDTLWQDSLVAAMDSALATQERETQRVRDSVRAAMRRGDEIVNVAETMDSHAGLVPGLTPHDSIVRLIASRDQWRRATLHYTGTVLPLLQRQIAGDSIWKLTALAKADTLTSQRDYARARVNEVTKEFRAYRESQLNRGSLNLGLFRLSKEAVEVVKLAGAAYAGCKVGGGC